jgi:hypothetical protein
MLSFEDTKNENKDDKIVSTKIKMKTIYFEFFLGLFFNAKMKQNYNKYSKTSFLVQIKFITEDSNQIHE